MAEARHLRDEAVELLRLLVACDTSNPPGREVQAAAVVEEHLRGSGVECERVAKDPERPNLVARLRGRGAGPSLAFLGHLDVVAARREDWSVDPFAGVVRDGAVWGRGTVDMKSQVAATTVALAALAREGFRPQGDLLLILAADEEVGDAGVGAPFLVEERPDLRPDYVIGEGAGERIPAPGGPIYLLDCGVKGSAPVTLTVHGTAADASLPGSGASALDELARLLTRLEAHRPPLRVRPELEPLLEAVAPGGDDVEERVARARAAHPALDRIVSALTRTVVAATTARTPETSNIVADRVTATLYCATVPFTTREELEAELRTALGPGRYELEVPEPTGGDLVSPAGSPLAEAIAAFLAERDPEARLVPALGFGYSDCHLMRRAYGSVAYGFVPFRHGDPLTNLTTKHGADERVLVDDLAFQVDAALSVARRIGGMVGRTAAAAAAR
jgi:acetylornithine deacetylase/succinyl-diaminopimelate desuccinylase-like protein